MSPPVRLPVLAIAAIAGVVVAGEVVAPWWLWGAMAIGAAAMRRGPRALRWMMVVALVMAALAARDGEAVPPPAGAIADDREVDAIEGWVSGPLLPGPGGTGFVVDADGAAVWATSAGGPPAWPGDRVRIVGRLETPRPRRNPGGIDRAQVVRGRGARWSMHAREVAVVRADDRASLWRTPARVAHASSRTIAARGGDAVGNALVRAAVVGDRSAVPPETDAAWRAAGVYHALSVSGLHLAVVALAAFVALTWVLAAVRPIAERIAPRRVAAAIALVMAIAYTLVTGGQVATLRALIVVAAVLIGAVIERRVRVADALGLAVLVLLAWRPSVLWDPGFQLSFVAAATLVIAARGDATAAVEFDDARGVRRIAPRIGRGVVRAIATSWAVTLATAPVTAHHFGEVALGGVIGNLIAGPAIELAAIPLGLIGLAVEAVWPAAGGAVLDLAIAIAGLTARLIEAIAAWTPMAIVRTPTAIELVACGGIYAAWAWARLARASGDAPIATPGPSWIATRAPAGLATIAALVLCGSWAWHAHDRATDDALRITILDVGQGDAAVIELPDGGVWLVDAGGAPGAGSRAMQVAPGRAVAAFLRARGLGRIDVAVVSHPHPDHYLGLLAVAAEVPIDVLWDARPPDAGRDDADPDDHAHRDERGGLSYDGVLAELAARGTRRVHPALGVHRFGDVAIEVIAPRFAADGVTAAAEATADPVRAVNDNSLVVAVVRAGRRVLFTGDLELEGEEALVADAAAGALASEVVKVPHHGSPTSSTAALVEATRPAWAIVSLARGNRFGFPGPEVVARWQAAGATVLRTDRAGAIEVVIDRAGRVDVSTYAGETWGPDGVIMPP